MFIYIIFYFSGPEKVPLQVIGVAEDFHFEPLYRKLNPVIFYATQDNLSEIAVRLNSPNHKTTIAQLSEDWERFGLEEAFNYEFLDESVQNLYQKEAVFFSVFSLFTGIAIIIACLGLFGLAAYTAQRKTKEIGIRKVIGASIMDVIILLNKDLFNLLLFAIIIAIPISWWGMQIWLDNFVYSTAIGWGVFVFAAVLVALIAAITVSLQSIRAAQSNPVKALMQE